MLHPMVTCLRSESLKKGKIKFNLSPKKIFSPSLDFNSYLPNFERSDNAVKAASKGEIPELVKPEEILGLFHVHTNWSDGADSLEDMVKTARKLGAAIFRTQ